MIPRVTPPASSSPGSATSASPDSSGPSTKDPFAPLPPLTKSLILYLRLTKPEDPEWALLRRPAAFVDPQDFDLTVECGDRMLQIMKARGGSGIAAPQVGISRRFFLFSSGARSEYHTLAINPTIVFFDKGLQVTRPEGCLSFPGRLRNMIRYENIVVEYTSLTGGRVMRRALSGVAAQVFQHEMDHLEGKVLFDTP